MGPATLALAQGLYGDLPGAYARAAPVAAAVGAVAVSGVPDPFHHGAVAIPAGPGAVVVLADPAGPAASARRGAARAAADRLCGGLPAGRGPEHRRRDAGGVGTGAPAPAVLG